MTMLDTTPGAHGVASSATSHPLAALALTAAAAVLRAPAAHANESEAYGPYDKATCQKVVKQLEKGFTCRQMTPDGESGWWAHKSRPAAAERARRHGPAGPFRRPGAPGPGRPAPSPRHVRSRPREPGARTPA
ncbi:hypothetical protein KBZ10_26400 [Streptomyces sp. F63]|uniref:hypothetical protein n=1 Tax=Streptomyces sp. F63 TaxID=2824887 RepID=UPI001B35FD21|nr:hypothetical protein [Streptomyces sp. F63]MBQ0987986.1 hypothetical protein [Streptomyces sp. F63]